MWYNGMDDDEPMTIAYAPWMNVIVWEKYEDIPVLTAGEEDGWDEEAVLELSVYFDRRVFHMWFTGSSGPFEDKVGCATSP